MAQIVCIDTDTYRAGINNIDDIVHLAEDSVYLGGGGYSGFKIIVAKGLSVVELDMIINLKIPKQSMAFKMLVTTWSLTVPQERRVWKDVNGKWQFLDEPPKYSSTVKNLTAQDRIDLGGDIKTKAEKLMILDKVQEKISLDSRNLVEATDLNV